MLRAGPWFIYGTWSFRADLDGQRLLSGYEKNAQPLLPRCGKQKWEIHGPRYQDASVLIATVLDRRRDLFAVHEPTLILDSTVVENVAGRQTYHTLTGELVYRTFHTEACEGYRPRQWSKDTPPPRDDIS